MICAPAPAPTTAHQFQGPQDLLFNVLYRADHVLMRHMIADSLDRLGDTSWPRSLPRGDLHLLRAAFFVLLHKDMELKELALRGIPPIIAPMDRRKASAFFLALEEEVLHPFFSDERRTKADLVDSLKHLYLCC